MVCGKGFEWVGMWYLVEILLEAEGFLMESEGEQGSRVREGSLELHSGFLNSRSLLYVKL